MDARTAVRSAKKISIADYMVTGDTILLAFVTLPPFLFEKFMVTLMARTILAALEPVS